MVEIASNKRKHSPSASSRSSATPAPPLYNSVTSNIPSNPSSPAEHRNEDELSLPGPSRTSQSSTPVPPSSYLTEQRTHAKAATLVPGSGDGTQFGDECFLWTDLPMNKGGFRYLPCSPSPNPSPFPLYPYYRTLPGPSTSPPVHISWLDRSSFLRVSVDGMTASTDRGYRSARANVSIREGCWYYEVRVERGHGAAGSGGGTGGDTGNAHVRIGWGRREANLDAPVGLDGYSYGIRDTSGEKVHLSRPKPYGKGFGTGDVIGCLIYLPPRPTPTDDPSDPSTIKRKRVPLIYKGQKYFEMDEYSLAKEMEALVDREGKGEAVAKAATVESAGKENVDAEAGKGGAKSKKGATTKNAKKGKVVEETTPSGPIVRQLRRLPGSTISFFLNGQPMGEAFRDLFDFIPLPPIAHTIQLKKSHHPLDPTQVIQHDDGTLGYFPMISCFGRGKVKCNFGPDFSFPVDLGDIQARPIVERFDEFREEERLLDERDEEGETERLNKEAIEREAEIKNRALYGIVSGKGKKAKKNSTSSAKRKKGNGLRDEITPTTPTTPSQHDGGSNIKFDPEGGGTPVSIDFDPTAESEHVSTPIKKEEGANGMLVYDTPASPNVTESHRATSEVSPSRGGSTVPLSEGGGGEDGEEGEKMEVDESASEVFEGESIPDKIPWKDEEEEESEEEEEVIEW